MGIIQTLGRTAWRKFITDGVPSSGANTPLKSEIIAFVDAVDTQVAAIANGITTRLASAALATTANTTLSGEQTIDGTLTSGTRIAVWKQSTGATITNADGSTNSPQNGVYVTGAGAWTRATDADTAAELSKSAIYVRGGTANQGLTIFFSIASSATIGTDVSPAIIIDDSETYATLETRVDTAEDDIDALQAADTALDGRLDTAESTLVTLDGRLDTAETEIDALQAADTAQGVTNSAFSTAIAAEAVTRAAGDALLNGFIAAQTTRIDGIEPMILNEREATQFWSNVISGVPVGRAALATGAVVTNNDGKAVRVTGNATVAPRAAYRIRANHVLRAEWSVRRATNPADPLGDSVSLMVAWLDKNYAAIGSPTQVEAINVAVADGRVTRVKELAAASGLGADYVGPSGTVYAVPYVQTFGPDGVTDIDWPLVIDVTAALNLSDEIAAQIADLGDITAAVAAAEQAAADAEAALAAINGTPGLNGLFSNAYLGKTAAYTVVNGDKGKTISLGGSDCYTLTFGAASTYDNEFGVIVVNDDTGRAKFISLNGTIHKLWPKQQAIVLNNNDVWFIDKPDRWKLTSETIFYVDSTAGVNYTNDGLAPGAGGAWAHEMLLYTHIVENIDIGGDFHLILQFADGTYTHGLHLAAHLIGRDGGDNFVIRGENATGTILAPTSAAGVGIYTGQSVRIRNMRIESASGNGVETAQAAGTMYIGANVVFGDCGGSHMSATDGHIVIDNPYTIDGDAGVGHYNAAAKGLIDGAGQTVTVAQNVSFGTAFAIASSNGVIGTPGFTFSLGAFTVTGPRYLLATGGIMAIGTLSETYFPGTVAGSNTGGQYNNAFGALTWTGLQTFAASTGFPVFYTFTDDGANGPQTISQHLSASPAVNDYINRHLMQGKDSGGTTTTYATWATRIADATDTSEDGLFDVSTVGAGTLAIRHTTGLGFYMAGATGGDKGAGTINATAVYDDNVLLSCYVFDQAFDKKISSKKWDALVPNRKTAIMENAIETYIDSDGVEQSYKTSKPTGKFQVEKRIHEPMRKFRDRIGTGYDPLTMEGYIAHCRDKRHLPSMPNEQKFDAEEGMPAGAWIQRLIEDAEIKAVLMAKMHERIEALETALATASKAKH